MRELFLATRNPGKIKEITQLFSDLPILLKSLLDYPNFDEISEVGSSYEENAKIKAYKVFNSFGIPTIADDSGLEVEILGNAPGIYSARYAGARVDFSENIKKLLSELKNVPFQKRCARFHCTAILVTEFSVEKTTGFCSGKIAFEPKGEGGFGYDSIFIPDGYNKTFAELEPEIKNTISHRAIAFNRMKGIIKMYI